MSTPIPSVSLETIQAFLDRASRVANDFGIELEDEIRLASEQPLDAAAAERIYTRVLAIVEDARESGTARDVAEARVKAEVLALVGAVERPNSGNTNEGNGSSMHNVDLVTRNGLEVHEVVPVPQFNGKIVPMREGYVDVTLLDPWAENARAKLYVDEFEAKHGRVPTADELLNILTGEITLGDGKADPFNLRPLANSIARKGVERPPIITRSGVPYDGNRRIAASRLVLLSSTFTEEEKERARWIKVWQTGDVTDDQLEAVVVALNFEEDLKQPWPEYVKARMVVERFANLREQQPGAMLPPSTQNKLKDEVARHYAIKRADVTRYLEMVKWSDDFMSYHLDAGVERAVVAHRTDTIFQWFYEIQAGTAGNKVTDQFEADPELRAMIYDLMYDATFDSGAQVRAMYLVAADAEAHRQLVDAHQIRESRPEEAREVIKDAINDARSRARAKKGLTLEDFSRQITKRLGETPATAWQVLDDELLVELRRALMGGLGAVNGELSTRGDSLALAVAE